MGIISVHDDFYIVVGRCLLGVSVERYSWPWFVRQKLACGNSTNRVG